VNETSIRDLFRLFDALQERCGGGGGGGGAPTHSLKHRYDLSFYFRAPSDGGGGSGSSSTPLQRANVTLTMPPATLERAAAAEARGNPALARAHWLALAVACVGRLYVALRILSPAPALAPALRALVGSTAREGASARPRSTAPPLDAISLLNASLAAMSPLVRGKASHVAATPGVGEGSVYLRRGREAAALRLLEVGGPVRPAAGLLPAQAARAFNAMRTLLTEHHDGLQLFDAAMWQSIEVVLGDSGVWRASTAESAQRALVIPWDFEREAALRFFGMHLPVIAVAARQAEARARKGRPPMNGGGRAGQAT